LRRRTARCPRRQWASKGLRSTVRDPSTSPWSLISDPRLQAFGPEYRDRAEAVLASLQSFFLTMPRGSSFCEREDFERGYHAFAEATQQGADVSGDALLVAMKADPRAWLVLRCILGVSPGEAGYLAAEAAAGKGEPLAVEQGPMRDLDARAKRGEPLLFDAAAPRKNQRDGDALLRRVVPLLGEVLKQVPPEPTEDAIHRLDKMDTSRGQETLVAAFRDGVSYSELLYERLLGRPYASHRDSVSGIVGDLIEGSIKRLLDDYGIDGAMARAREKVPGFVQAPDCRVPSENPRIIIEAKLTEDDGTARDKVARVQTLRTYEDAKPEGERCQIVALVDGRGFGHRMADLRRLMEATDGHVYTLAELPLLVADNGVLAPFVTKQP